MHWQSWKKKETKKQSRGGYNVENLKLSRDHHENCKTHLKGNFFIHLFFNNKRACEFSYNTQLYTSLRSKQNDVGKRDFFSILFFNGFHI